MKRTILALVLATALCTAQDKIPVTRIDPATWIWRNDSTLVVMRVTVTSRDTIATYRYFKLIKAIKASHFNIDRWLDKQRGR